MSSANSRIHNNDKGSRISLSSYSDNNSKRIKSVASAINMTTSLLDFKDQISNEVPQNRRQEIHEYMSLFGYKPDRTIIQVHI